jgi:GST-like protein
MKPVWRRASSDLGVRQAGRRSKRVERHTERLFFASGLHVSPKSPAVAASTAIWVRQATGRPWHRLAGAAPKETTPVTDTPDYQPPEVWQWNKANGGRFANINRPIAGATHEKELPVGAHPLQLYSLGTPNGVKVTVMLEELLALGHKGAEYDAWLIKIGEGDQFGSGFVAINPNSKIPALLDRSTTPPRRVFESGAILLYLAEKFGALLPKDPAERTEALNWLFWQMGSAPYLGGGFGHFYAYAPAKFEYAIDRFAMETKRQLDVLERNLADRAYMAGDEYSIADIAIWPWYGQLVQGHLYGAAKFLAVHEYTNVQRWAGTIAARPAVVRGRMVNRMTGDPASQLRERHAASDFETKTQDKLGG